MFLIAFTVSDFAGVLKLMLWNVICHHIFLRIHFIYFILEFKTKRKKKCDHDLDHVVMWWYAFQMNGSLKTAILIAVIVGACLSVCAGQYSAARCRHACGNTFSSVNRRTCDACARNPPISYEMCSYACDNTLYTQTRQICEKCVSRVELSDQMCIKACGNTLYTQYRQICERCERNPPITDNMCIHACGNTLFSQFRSICDVCVRNPPVTDALCIHACSNTLFTQFRTICNNHC